MLLIFWEQDYYCTYCLSGSTADAVIDSEARNIILDKLDEYYWDSSLDEDEYFSKAFSTAADEIMKKPSSGVGAVAIPLVIFVAALAIEIVLKNKEKQAKKDAELKEMLNKPLETFGSTEADELAKKYDSKDDKATSSSSVQADSSSQSSATAETSSNIVCKKCGQKLSNDSIYCSNCGEKV